MKKEYIILAVAIAALVLYLVLRDSDRTNYELPDLSLPGKEQITRIDINGPNGTIALQRSDDVWKSQPAGYPIDDAKIEGMLGALSGLDLISLVSESGNYLQYDLQGEKSVSVTASDGEKALLKLDIGKTASTHRHTYVKLEGDGNVYQAGDNIRRFFDVNLPGIRDKKVMTFDRTQVTGLTISSGGETLKLAKVSRTVEPTEEGGSPPQTVIAWVTPDSTDADGTVVDGILSRVTNLQCDGFPADTLDVELGEPAYTLILDGPQMETLNIYGQSGEKMFLATSSQYDFPFLLSEWRKSQIAKPLSEMMGEKAEEDQ